jgi:hypothetical protein
MIEHGIKSEIFEEIITKIKQRAGI